MTGRKDMTLSEEGHRLGALLHEDDWLDEQTDFA
jgi:hypothetical protein